ncbi:MAG: isoleucine--tRNA ligase, partial [Candidatus Bathyarchaeota archaeon]
FLEGPPTINGFMHVGHARGRAMKDVILRYKTMAGYDVWRQAGWDCQGLPVELEVEKKLGVSSKKEIEDKIGFQRFAEECNSLVDYYLGFWREASEKLGVSLDYDNAYETRRRSYIEFVWWALKEADKKGLLVEDFKVVPKCPRCETSLSGHEVAQGYASTTDPSIYVKFPLKNSSNTFIVIWTTTPWTLPGDEAVSVHPSQSYAKLKVGNEVWLLAEKRVEVVMKELGIKDYETIGTFPGKVLEGQKYTHPLEDEVQTHKEHKGRYDHAIICGEHVTLEEGTGCVHTAPAHGPEDFEIGKKYGLQIFCPVDSRGRFTSEGGKYASIPIKDANMLIIEDLDQKHLLLKSGVLEHEYPFCWRCNSPLIYLADKQWFLRVGPLKNKILQENSKTNWVPEWAGLNRFEDWLVNAEDWCISRSRIWGSPLNVWICTECGEKLVVGTVKELEQFAKNLPEKLELHRPWIDQILLKCPSCNGDMKRVEYVVDCWFDSGVAHGASLGLDGKALFNILYPFDFITEAIDQTRGWFYSLVFTGIMLFDKNSYKRVLCQGHVLDKFGQKMSKSKGNVVWALDAMNEVGADSLRLYELWKTTPWDSLLFDYEEIEQVKRQLSILWNIFVFVTTYMKLDEFTPEIWTLDRVKNSLRVEDQWLLSRTQSLIKDVTENLDSLCLQKSIRSLLTFITEDLSRFYIRLVRKRTWIEKNDPEKLAAYATLYLSLSALLRLLAPFAPYLTEELYQAFERDTHSKIPISIHMCNWPEPDNAWLNEQLEAEMSIVEEILTAVFYARQKAKLKVRWPVKEVYVSPTDSRVLKATEKLRSLFLDQANTKELKLLAGDDLPPGVMVEAGLNFDVAGPTLKDKIPKISKFLKSTDGLAVRNEVTKTGKYFLKLDETTLELPPSMFVFKEVLPENIISVDSTYGRVYLDISRTSGLLAESMANEVIRRTQVMRKEMNLRIEEYIDAVVLVAEKETVEGLISLSASIASEIRAKELILTDKEDEFKPVREAYVKDWDIDVETVKIAISRSEKN